MGADCEGAERATGPAVPAARQSAQEDVAEQLEQRRRDADAACAAPRVDAGAAPRALEVRSIVELLGRDARAEGVSGTGIASPHATIEDVVARTLLVEIERISGRELWQEVIGHAQHLLTGRHARRVEQAAILLDRRGDVLRALTLVASTEDQGSGAAMRHHVELAGRDRPSPCEPTEEAGFVSCAY